jgi:very-short-patch-repair endonuclease
MSRFKGWTKEAVEKLECHSERSEESSGRSFDRLRMTKGRDHCGIILNALQVMGIKAVREYRFLHDRRFRFDIAIPEHKIAIEFEGGIFKRGRHNRGKGYSNDAKKYNLSTMHGWKLLRYTPDLTKTINWEFKIAAEVKKLINGEKCG